MNKKLIIKTLNELQECTHLVLSYNAIIEKRKKTDKNFQEAFKIGKSLYKKSSHLIRHVKKIFTQANFSFLKKAELNELIYIYSYYQKMCVEYPTTYGFLKIFLPKSEQETRKCQFVMQRNSLFIFSVNFVTRNFFAITLPKEYDVNKFQNDVQKISLPDLLQKTEWNKFFTDAAIRKEFIDFSKLIVNSNWWIRAKYYRNNFVHRISLDTYSFDGYHNINVRIKAYLPLLCFLCLKYFFYSMISELKITSQN